MQTSLLKMSSVFFLFFCVQIQFTEAQIIYTDVMPDSVISAANDTLSLDLNKDGIIDFNLTITSKNATSFGCTGSRVNKYLKVSPADTNNSILSNTNLPSALALNTSIDSGSKFWKNTAFQKMAADTYRCTRVPRGMTSSWFNGGSGNFRNTTDKCLAVRFYAGTKLYYGWIRFSVSSNVTVTLKDYAYQSSGAPSIVAGQTSDNYIATSAPNKSLLCAGDSFNVGYVYLGNFDPTNVISVEFSDSIGNFIKGTIIGSDKGNISGTIRCVIPLSFSGTGYRFRIFSSNPSQNITNNGTNLIINKGLSPASITPSAKTQFVCSGSSVALSAPVGNGFTYQWKKDGANLAGGLAVVRIYNANTTGLFSCAITNGCGTVQSNAVSLTVIQLPPAISIIPAGPHSITSRDSVVFSPSTVYPNYIHRWYRNSILLNPLTSTTTYTAKTTGTYTLKIEDPVYGCSSTSSGVGVYVLQVSSVPKTQSVQSNLKVQPNPFSNNVFISFSMKDRQNFSVSIVDLTGRLVKTIASNVLGGGDFEYNWMADDQNGNSINSGVYFLKLETKTFSQTEKLILVR